MSFQVSGFRQSHLPQAQYTTYRCIMSFPNRNMLEESGIQYWPELKKRLQRLHFCSRSTNFCAENYHSMLTCEAGTECSMMGALKLIFFFNFIIFLVRLTGFGLKLSIFAQPFFYCSICASSSTSSSEATPISFKNSLRSNRWTKFQNTIHLIVKMKLMLSGYLTKLQVLNRSDMLYVSIKIYNYHFFQIEIYN